MSTIEQWEHFDSAKDFASEVNAYDAWDDATRHRTLDYIRGLVELIEDMDSWDGLMEQLARHYPHDVFPDLHARKEGDPGDIGPRIIRCIRELDQLRKAWGEIGQVEKA